MLRPTTCRASPSPAGNGSEREARVAVGHGAHETSLRVNERRASTQPTPM